MQKYLQTITNLLKGTLNSNFYLRQFLNYPAYSINAFLLKILLQTHIFKNKDIYRLYYPSFHMHYKKNPSKLR